MGPRARARGWTAPASLLADLRGGGLHRDRGQGIPHERPEEERVVVGDVEPDRLPGHGAVVVATERRVGAARLHAGKEERGPGGVEDPEMIVEGPLGDADARRGPGDA